MERLDGWDMVFNGIRYRIGRAQRLNELIGPRLLSCGRWDRGRLN